MFDESLLESSPSRVSTLKRKHWLLSIAIGVVVFLAVFFAVPMLSFGADTKIVLAQAIILGLVFTAYALMLCYVVADATHLKLNPWLWFAVVLVFNVVGFLIYLCYSAAKTDNWMRATIPIAYIIEGLIVGAMVLVPLIYTEALPSAQLMTFLAAPPPPPPPPPPPAAAAPRIVKRVTVEDIMKAPTVIPKTVKIIKDEPEPVANTGAVGVVGGIPGGVPGGTFGGVLGAALGGSLTGAAAPPPPPPPKAVTPKRIRVGGQVESARLIFQPKPEYPPLAKMARIQGTVRLEAVISKDGTIQDLKVVSGHPLLVKAALEAVQRWRYQPTLLNGEPVEVVTEVDVNFTLSE
jgi:periplasmic protein TonB